MLQWLNTKLALKCCFVGLALSVMSVLMPAVYDNPKTSPDFMHNIIHSSGLQWIIVLSVSLLIACSLLYLVHCISLLIQKHGEDINYCEPTAHIQLSSVSGIVFSIGCCWIVWSTVTLNAPDILISLFLLYGVVVVRIPMTCTNTFGHCHRCAKAIINRKRHTRETIMVIAATLLVFTIVYMLKPSSAAVARTQSDNYNQWQLPSIPHGRVVYNSYVKTQYSRLRSLENTVDDCVYEGASPLTVYQTVSNAFPKMCVTDQWNLALYLRARTAAPPRENLEKELFEKWRTWVVPHAPICAWYDWQTMQTLDDAAVADMITTALHTAPGTNNYTLADYELQRMVDLVRSLTVRL